MKISLGLVVLAIPLHLWGAPLKWSPKYQKEQMNLSKETREKVTQTLKDKFKKEYTSHQQLKALKKETLTHGGMSVPALIDVMKRSDYPEKNRWMATFLLGQIMGDKAAPFISKFSGHPHWMMRTASLKTLLALKQKNYTQIYSNALADKSLIVRRQALENIRALGLKDLGKNVWGMLFDKTNYTKDKKGKLKRTYIISSAIRTLGDIKYDKVKSQLIGMAQTPKYADIFSDIEYSLSKITGKTSPQGSLSKKREFWKKLALKK